MGSSEVQKNVHIHIYAYTHKCAYIYAYNFCSLKARFSHKKLYSVFFSL